MGDPGFSILHEDNHLLVVSKPAELPTMGVAEGEPNLVVLAKQYLKRKYNKPGNVYLGVVSRLDALVTGLVVLARTSKAANRLSAQFRDAVVDKTYWALVAGAPNPPNGQCTEWVRKVERLRRMEVTRQGAAGAKLARLRYQTQSRSSRFTHLEVQLLTGRKHQIRLQLAHLGHPIVGDRKYGSRQQFPQGIALHARRLHFQHPVGQQPLEFEAELPPYWREFADFPSGVFENNR